MGMGDCFGAGLHIHHFAKRAPQLVDCFVGRSIVLPSLRPNLGTLLQRNILPSKTVSRFGKRANVPHHMWRTIRLHLLTRRKCFLLGYLSLPPLPQGSPVKKRRSKRSLNLPSFSNMLHVINLFVGFDCWLFTSLSWKTLSWRCYLRSLGRFNHRNRNLFFIETY